MNGSNILALVGAAFLRTVERGKLADLVVVNGDPLRDVSVMRNVELAVKNGSIAEISPELKDQ